MVMSVFSPIRMVAAGASYGGFLAATVLGRPHPFKALVAHAAVYNRFTQIGTDYGAEKDRFFEFWEKPDEFAQKIFDRFAQVPGGETGAAGLGLSLAAEIAAVHGGKLKLANPGKPGARFECRLPASKA